MPVIDNRMGISTVVALLDLWLDRKWELSHEEYDWLCARCVDFLGEARDEVWRLRRLEAADTLLDIEVPGEDAEE